MKKALIIMMPELVEAVYSKETQDLIRKDFALLAEPLTADNCKESPELLKQVEVIFSGWGAPVFDEAFLKLTPKLEAIFYAAGTMKSLLTEKVWERQITISTANTINAIPVAEYTVSMILFSLKNGWPITRKVRGNRTFHFREFSPLGLYKRTIGLISLSQVGRKTLELLKPFDVDIVYYDPFVSKEAGEEMGAEKVSLEELFKISDVVSLHSPLLPETEGLISGELIESMKQNATFINTARGAIVKEQELIDVLKARKDLTAILDVTDPEPPSKESELFDLANIVVTPHIAGSAGSETLRLGDAMLEEAKRYIKDEPLHHRITKEQYQRMA